MPLQNCFRGLPFSTTVFSLTSKRLSDQSAGSRPRAVGISNSLGAGCGGLLTRETVLVPVESLVCAIVRGTGP